MYCTELFHKCWLILMERKTHPKQGKQYFLLTEIPTDQLHIVLNMLIKNAAVTDVGIIMFQKVVTVVITASRSVWFRKKLPKWRNMGKSVKASWVNLKNLVSLSINFLQSCSRRIWASTIVEEFLICVIHQCALFSHFLMTWPADDSRRLCWSFPPVAEIWNALESCKSTT